MTGLGKEPVVFWSSFLGSRFTSVWLERNGIGRDGTSISAMSTSCLRGVELTAKGCGQDSLWAMRRRGGNCIKG